MSFNELNVIMMNADKSKINLEKCRHLDTNLFNEISKYKQNVPSSVCERSSNVQYYSANIFHQAQNDSNRSNKTLV